MQRIYRDAQRPSASWLPHEYMLEEGEDPNQHPTTGIPPASTAYNVDKSVFYRMGTDAHWHLADAASERAGPTAGQTQTRVTSLDDTPFMGGTVLEVIGIPAYVSDVAEYAAFGLTDSGWYAFARVKAPTGMQVTAQTAVTGAAGCVKEIGADHIDAAVRFEVAATSRTVTVAWNESKQETFVFKATDLAVRNLDYRTTFYVYDAAPFVQWTYALTTDATFASGKNYYMKIGDTYAPVTLAACYVRVIGHALTTDETFQEGTVYYTESSGEYTEAEVTPGETVTASTYYVETVSYTQTEDAVFQAGTAYFFKDGDEYAEATVIPGDPVPVYPGAAIPTAYYTHSYVLTEDETFASGKTYYLLPDGTFQSAEAAEVTSGDAVTGSYYEDKYTLIEGGTFAAGTVYYTKSGSAYTAAEVTAGDAVPALYYVHSKVTFSGMARNVTYQFDEIIDCPSEFILPVIEDDGHGAWFEIRLRHAGSYSSTLVPLDPEVKIATEHTQKETAGMNMIDLHYLCVGGAKIWRFMNTHSSIPA